MDEFRTDAYCGLYCGACEILNAYRKSLVAGRRPLWSELPERFTKYIKEAEIKCHGCKSDTVFEGCASCGIRTCAREKNIDFCFECVEYPCDTINEMKANVDEFRKFLPHTGAIVNNLTDIERLGKEAWLDTQRQFWSCAHCGAALTWYQEHCDICGKGV